MPKQIKHSVSINLTETEWDCLFHYAFKNKTTVMNVIGNIIEEAIRTAKASEVKNYQ